MACLSRIVTAALLIAALAAPLARADDNAGADVRAGLQAARQHDFTRAAAHFQAALRSDPESPLIHYNLGLAEAEIPGRELRAMCWLGAYIAAWPEAADNTAIRDKIDMLTDLSRRNVDRLIALYRQAGDLTPDDRRSYKDHVLFRTAALYVQAGDAAKAEELIPDIDPASDYGERLRRAISGDTVIRISVVAAKTEDESKAYRVDRHEALSPWDRLFRWLARMRNASDEQDAERAAAWIRSCDGYALSQALFADQAAYLRTLADNYASRAEWGASAGLASDVAAAAAEVIYVHNTKTAELRDLIAAVETPWTELAIAATLLGGYALSFLIVPFLRLDPSASKTSTGQKMRVAAIAFVAWLGLAAWAAQATITASERFAGVDLLPGIIGGAFLLLIVLASFAALWVFILATKALFVREKAR
jgi:hypothetical protein